MTITRKTIATLTAAAALAGSATPAVAFEQVGGISNGPVQPTFKWTHAKWKTCWKLSYAQARQDGFSPNASQAYADLVCGDPPLT